MARTIFKTDKKENLTTKATRIGFNFYPAYRRTGGRVCFITEDWKEIHITLGLNWKTKNYVGTVFGGSIYGALDPMYMIQLIKILGENYIVWDKAATIKFIKPIKKIVFARFLVTDEILDEIIAKVKSDHKFSIDLMASFQDENEIMYAEVTKTIYIADKDYYKTKKAK